MTILNIFNFLLDVIKKIMSEDIGRTFFYFGILYFTVFILKEITYGNR